MNNIKIAGILFQQGEDDYSLWEGFYLNEDEQQTIMEILEKHDHEGGSVSGTYNQIIVEG